MTRPLRVFLCHASQDKPYVLRLHRYLKQHGVEPWLDRDELLPGQNWAVEISKALDASDVILVCLSKDSINKEGFVQKEISFALDKALEKPEGMIFIIPIKLEECELPRNLNRYHCVDLFRDGGRKRLLMGLNRRATEIGEDITPVQLEDTKQRTPKPFKPELKQEESIDLISSKDDVKEEPKQEMPLPLSLPEAEIKQENIVPEVKKEIEQEKPVIKSAPIVEKKPFTKVLNPSSLVPKSIRDSQSVKKSSPDSNVRWLGIGGIFFGVLFFVWIFGDKYIANNSLATKTPAITLSPPLESATPRQTNIPLTSTFTLAPSTLIPTPIPTLGIGSTMISEKDGMTLVYIPAGEFTMGNNDSDQSDEHPEHQIFLDEYWIDQTEVTNAMYTQCVNENQCDLPLVTLYFFNVDYANHPATYISWNNARTYCEWAGRKLPTEAEWEKAARGPSGNTYPWGENISCNQANYGNCIGDTTIVASYENGKSFYEVYDMVGNVWEWVSSLYLPYSYDADDGRENASSAADRVLRGGAWDSDRNNASSSNRNWLYFYKRTSNAPAYLPLNASPPYNLLGFRCALSDK